MSDTTPTPKRSDGLAIVGVVLSLLAVVGAIVGVGLGVRAVDEADGGTGVAAGGTISLVNGGAAIHNLAVEGADLQSPDVPGGDSARMELRGLDPGEYTVYCAIAGHREAGMEGTLTVTGDGEVAQGGDAGHGAMSYEEMDAIMRERTTAFPAETEGVGAQELAPEVLADGTKQFELTADETTWEVEPGKKVTALAYNGQVPGPTLRVDVGDKVRVVVRNELEESTAVHFHGLFTPNSMDGVPDITQPPIVPGEDFVYEFVAREAQVGMYHSHHDAHVQVTNGLLGAFYVGEMPLPAGVPTPAVDIPMVLNDAGAIGLSINGKSFPATAPVVARVGDWVKIDYMNEGMQIHPMHLHGMPQMVIAKDGWPVAQPQMMDTVNIAPGERVSVLVHATEPGAWAWHCHILNHAEASTGMFGMVTALVVQ